MGRGQVPKCHFDMGDLRSGLFRVLYILRVERILHLPIYRLSNDFYLAHSSLFYLISIVV